MRATLNIPDELIEQLMAETGEKNKTKIIRNALEDMLRKIRRKKFKNLRGKIDLDLDLEKYRAQDMI
ncbi:MAG: type II toxin-antitoxin system VapB family antitoxin [bacterium]|nr:type II toxin-antitoxin system VapB family antitoxin [bacterium]